MEKTVMPEERREKRSAGTTPAPKLPSDAHPKCPSCRFSSLYLNQQAQILRVCRFEPPVPFGAFVPVPGIPGLAPGTVGLQFLSNTQWPVVLETDWCASHEPAKAANEEGATEN